MINVSELITDPDFAQPNGIEVIRTTYTIVDHEPELSQKVLRLKGIVTIANDKSIQMDPEADRSAEQIHVFTREPLYTTGATDEADEVDYISDIVVWQNVKYKVQSVLDDVQYGFNRATCEKMRQDVM